MLSGDGWTRGQFSSAGLPSMCSTEWRKLYLDLSLSLAGSCS